MKYNGLLLRNVFGKKTELNIGGGVSKISNLNTSGKAGEIYYNTSDGKYYIYNGTSFVPFGTSDMIFNEVSLVEKQKDMIRDNVHIEGNYYEAPIIKNAYNFLGELGSDSTTVGEDPNAVIDVVFADSNSNYVNSYVGGFSVVGSALSISFPNNIFIADGSDTTFEVDHVYEFNILNTICIIKDVTPIA